AKVAVNGRPLEKPPQPGTFVSIERTWNPGDKVELDLPMTFRLVKGRNAQSGRVAVMRGPVVYCLNRSRHKDLAQIEPRLLTIAPETLEGPLPDATVRPDGLACKVRAWRPGAWYPQAKTDFELVLTEYPDAGGEAIYFHVPNPNAAEFVEDELIAK
ncbi:MAG: glycoside hydrolase family 127 protein, partial [Thermoguttaceae bacterium]|nr:glycoside hydrolase family 127 protein [Thermoguttaceae bacterium]